MTRAQAAQLITDVTVTNILLLCILISLMLAFITITRKDPPK